jgi:hypothetical protein
MSGKEVLKGMKTTLSLQLGFESMHVTAFSRIGCCTSSPWTSDFQCGGRRVAKLTIAILNSLWYARYERLELDSDKCFNKS